MVCNIAFLGRGDRQAGGERETATLEEFVPRASISTMKVPVPTVVLSASPGQAVAPPLCVVYPDPPALAEVRQVL